MSSFHIIRRMCRGVILVSLGAMACSSEGRKWDFGQARDGVLLPPDAGPHQDGVIRPEVDASTADGQSGPCATGEKPFGGHCYRMAGIMGMTYATAKDLCANQSPPMQPAAVTSAAENQFVYGELPAYNQVSWIGLKRTGTGAQDFAWENGEAATFWNWAPGEPNNEDGQEDCGVIWGPALSLIELRSFWNDSPCDYNLVSNIICERQP